MSQEKFIRIANEVHNGKYDYSRVVYKNMDTKVIIGCPIHGYFEQVPYTHIHMGYGCEKCGYVMTGNKLKKSQDKFIKEAKLVHGDKYDYSKVEYKNANTEVTIICPIHGEFKQLPYCHVNQKSGCYECGRLKSSNNRHIGIKKFVEDSRKSHTENYDYSKSVYVNSNTEIEIICQNTVRFFNYQFFIDMGQNVQSVVGEIGLQRNTYSKRELFMGINIIILKQSMHMVE